MSQWQANPLWLILQIETSRFLERNSMMRIRSKACGIALAAGGAVVLAGMVIAAPGTALAATATPATIGSGNMELCANGNYNAELSFLQFGTSSALVDQGTCKVFSIPGGGGAVEILGFFNTHPNQSFDVGEITPTGASVLCRAEGTTTDPSFNCTTF
jgi:hypothetical protein